jgi:hypothetical protein
MDRPQARSSRRSRKSRQSGRIRGHYTGTFSVDGPHAITVDFESERNGARGPDFFQLDMRLGYRLRLGDQRTLDLFGGVCNVTDRAKFSNPTQPAIVEFPAADRPSRRGRAPHGSDRHPVRVLKRRGKAARPLPLTSSRARYPVTRPAPWAVARLTRTMVASSVTRARTWQPPAARAFAADGERAADGRSKVPPQPIEFRLESLERRVTSLELLPARMDDLVSQILHLRTEMRAEFSAVRSEMGGMGAALGQEIADQGAALRQEVADQGAALRQEIADQGVTLRRDIEGLATHMRVLHEEVIARIALLHEAPRARSRRRKA